MATKKLGKGLGAILGDIEKAYEKDVSSSKDGFVSLDVDKIVPNPFQPRKNFEQEGLQELSESIKKHGLIQPILVVERNDDFMLIAGERRLRASKLAGLHTIKAVIAKLPQSSFREIALIENIQRKDLNPIELAHSYKELISEHEITHEELARLIHKSRTSITNTLRLLELDPYVQDKILNAQITHGHAKILVSLDPKEQIKLADSIINQNLNVRQTEHIVKNMRTITNEVQRKNIVSNLETDQLQDLLGAIGIKSKARQNKFIIELQSQEDVDKLSRELQ